MKSSLLAIFILLLSQASLAENGVSQIGFSKSGAALQADCGGLYRTFNLYQTLYPRGTDAQAKLAPEDIQIQNLQDKADLLLILIKSEGMPGYKTVEDRPKCIQSLKEFNQNIFEERSKQLGFSENNSDQVTMRASKILEFAEKKLTEQANK